MSVDYLWCAGCVPPANREAVDRDMRTLLASGLTERAGAALAAWATQPAMIDSDEELLDGFLEAFVMDDRETAFRISRNCAKNAVATVTLDRRAPAAVLWYALGPAGIAHLPGSRGNMLVSAQSVHELLRKTESYIADHRVDMLRRANTLLERTNCGPGTAAEILDFLPKALSADRPESCDLVFFRVS